MSGWDYDQPWLTPPPYLDDPMPVDPDDPAASEAAFLIDERKTLMTASSFKMILGILQIIGGVVAPYAAGIPFSMQTLFMNLIALFAGGHAITSATTNK